jgi:glycosyl transferase family 87
MQKPTTAPRPSPSLRHWTPRALFLAAMLLAIAQVPVAASRQGEWGHDILRRPGYSDFGQFYLYAWMGIHRGWNTLYDVAVQRPIWEAMGGIHFSLWYPMVYPPFIAWLAAPFALLPFGLAVTLWSIMLLALFLLIWKLATPAGGLAGWTLLAAAFALYPVSSGLMVTQAVILNLAAITLCWWLLVKQREVLAGLALSLALVKPQIGFLVPLALLAAGRWKTFASWAVTATALATVALLSVGWTGVRMAQANVAQLISSAPPPHALTIPSLLGNGPVGHGGQVLLVAFALAIAYHHRRDGPHLPVAAGLVASILVTSYIRIPDLTALLVAAWIALHGQPSRWARLLLFGAYALMLVPSFLSLGEAGNILNATLVGVEILWLATMYPNLKVSRAETQPLAA